MKKGFTILIISALFMQTFAQNILCREFGADYQSVIEFLKARGNVEVKLDQDNRVIAMSPAFLVTYYFNQDKLHRIYLQRDYDKKKDAEATFESFNSYFHLLNPAGVTQTETENETVLSVNRGSRAYEVVLSKNLKTKLYEIRLTQNDFSISPVHPVPSFTPEESAIYAAVQY